MQYSKREWALRLHFQPFCIIFLKGLVNLIKFLKAAAPAILTAAVMLFTAFTPASASSAAYETYKAANGEQTAYYRNVYKPYYRHYQDTIKKLRLKIRETKLENRAQANEILSFLRGLVDRHRAFYGTRTTEGASRCEVPKIREIMYYTADRQKDYDTAADLCNQLKLLIKARVDFMEMIVSEIENYGVAPGGEQPENPENPENPDNPVYDCTVVVNVKQINSLYSFEFKIVITNNTAADVSGWGLSFNADNVQINTVWVDGGAVNMSQEGNRVSLAMQNEYQTGYTISAGQSLEIWGIANGNAYDAVFSNALFNNKPVQIGYNCN